MTTHSRMILTLAALVLVAGAALTWLVRDATTTAAVTTAESTEAIVASAETKSAARAAASEAASRAYSYSWKTLTDDRAAARDLMTVTMQRRYDRTMAGVGTSSRLDHSVVTAEVVGSALVTASAAHARVLVFVNQRTSSDDLEEPLLDLDRVLVTLDRVDGDWRVSELDSL